MEKKYVKELFQFIEDSPTAFHAVDTMKKILERNGYQGLLESGKWKLADGGKYYVTRNGSSLIAFRIPSADFKGFQIMAGHSDSPCLKIKENPDMRVEQAYIKLDAEKYGGMLCGSWFDRPLSAAGRLMVRDNNRIRMKLVNVDRDLLMIPSLAIHMNREANDGYKYNVQKDMPPLYKMCAGGEQESFMEMIAREAGVKEEDILGSDLYVYNRMKGSVWGAGGEFISKTG